MSATGPFIALLLLLGSLVGGGCASGPSPLGAAELGQREPSLRIIHDAMNEIIDTAHEDPSRSWHSGWIGNTIVKFGGDQTFGYCYHWQELVYFDIEPQVRRVGWDLSGIEINRGSRNEHHAVLVWDPDRIHRSDALAAPRTAPVYVLDAWRRGRADIYPLADWLELPRPNRTPLAFEDLDALEEPRRPASPE
jgi:hypothetical protein